MLNDRNEVRTICLAVVGVLAGFSTLRTQPAMAQEKPTTGQVPGVDSQAAQDTQTPQGTVAPETKKENPEPSVIELRVAYKRWHPRMGDWPGRLLDTKSKRRRGTEASIATCTE